MTYRQIQIIGGSGGGFDPFPGALRAITVDSRGIIYAAGHSEIKVFDPAGKLAARWPTAQPALSVAVARDGSVFVGELNRIEIFRAGGKLSGTWSDAKLLGRVTAIGFHGGSVFAGDAADRAIRHFDAQGHFRNNIGKDNNVNGLLIPNGVVDFGVDLQGVVHAANPGKHRVERYTADGALLGHIGRFSAHDPAGFTGCCNPTNIAIADRIYVTEKAGPRAKAYEFNGNLAAVIAADVFDPNAKNMSIAAGPSGRVYVADTAKNAILVFAPEGV
jgi:hypothetical protein